MLNTSDVKSLSKGGTTVSLEEINNSIDNKLSIGNLIGINGIDIAKNAASDKVEIKIGEEFASNGFIMHGSNGKSTTIKPTQIEVQANDATYQEYIEIDGKKIHHYEITGFNQGVPTAVDSVYLHQGNVKTIGGQSIYGSGDITVGGSVSLYRHNIKMNSSQHQVYFTLISSSDTALNTAAKIANEINATVSATGVVTNAGKKLWVYCVDALAVLGNVTIYAMDEAGNTLTVMGSQLTITDKVKAI